MVRELREEVERLRAMIGGGGAGGIGGGEGGGATASEVQEKSSCTLTLSILL